MFPVVSTLVVFGCLLATTLSFDCKNEFRPEVCDKLHSASASLERAVLDANAALLKSVVSAAHQTSIFEHALHELVKKQSVKLEGSLSEAALLLKEAKDTRQIVTREGLQAVQEASQKIADSLGSSLLIAEGSQEAYIDLQGLKKLLSEKLSNARHKLKIIIKVVKQRVQEGTERVRKILKELFEKLGLKDKWNEIKQVIDSYDSVRFALSSNDETQDTKESFDVATSTLTSFLDEVKYDVRVTKRGFLEGIKYIWEKIKNALVRLGTAIKDACMNFFNKHHDAIMKALDLTGKVVVAVGKKLIMVAIAAGTEQIIAAIIGAVG